MSSNWNHFSTPQYSVAHQIAVQTAAARSRFNPALLVNPIVTLCTSAIIIPDVKTNEGTLIASTSVIWHEIIRRLEKDWSEAFQIPADKCAPTENVTLNETLPSNRIAAEIPFPTLQVHSFGVRLLSAGIPIFTSKERLTL